MRSESAGPGGTYELRESDVDWDPHFKKIGLPAAPAPCGVYWELWVDEGNWFYFSAGTWHDAAFR